MFVLCSTMTTPFLLTLCPIVCVVLFTLFASLVANQAHPTPRERREEGNRQDYEKEGREYTIRALMHYAILSEKGRREVMSIRLLVGWFV